MLFLYIQHICTGSLCSDVAAFHLGPSLTFLALLVAFFLPMYRDTGLYARLPVTGNIWWIAHSPIALVDSCWHCSDWARSYICCYQPTGHTAEQGEGGAQRPPAGRGGEDGGDQADHQEPTKHGHRGPRLKVNIPIQINLFCCKFWTCKVGLSLIFPEFFSLMITQYRKLCRPSKSMWKIVKVLQKQKHFNSS